MQSLQQQFLTWCRSRPADETFNPWKASACAGFQFLRENGYPVSGCYVSTWVDDSRCSHNVPPAMAEAINWACGASGIAGTVTFGALADRLEAALS